MTNYLSFRQRPDNLPVVRKLFVVGGWEVVDIDFHPAWS
jgi:hypothetical protein